MLTKIVTYHVVPQQLTPMQLAGTYPTLEKQNLTISGASTDFTVGAAKAGVVCGNAKTANATVYLVDTVLMPPAS
jgi:uncharacterized surface protein with fasciclin (FAS1) repeats